jgi:hypothetical protein
MSLAMTAQGADFKKARATQKASAAQPSTSARSMNASSVRTQRNYSAQRFQRNYNATPRTTSSAVVRQNNLRANRVQATHARNFSSNNTLRSRNNVTVNHTKNLNVNRERNVAVNRQKNFNASRERNLAVNRERNVNRNVTVNRNVNRNFNVNRQRNVTVTNNWRGQRFSGQRYSAFRNYHREWHDRGWWNSHHSRIVFVFGAPYYWSTGYWYPAWGYYPGYNYPYDGPIYGYNDLTPDQVVVNVQGQLQADGYYNGSVDGVLGPATRQAIADYQADHGLAVTASVDEPTLQNLGLV